MHPVDLHVGSFTPSLLIDLTRSSGRFAAAGLEVRESPVVSSPAQFASLDAGELDLVMTSPDNVLAYRFLSANPLGKNLPVEIIGGIDRGLGLSLWTGAAVTGIDAVRDGTFAVDVPQSGFAFVAYGLLERAGLAPGDYVLESLGSTPRRAAALIAGECTATVLNAGNELRAEAAGCHLISRVSDIGPYLGTVVAALATADDDLVDARRRFVDALLETSREILAGHRDSDVVESAVRLLDLGENEARAHLACLLDPERGLIPDGLVDEASVSTLIDLRRTYAPTPELDVVAASWPEMVVDRARTGSPDTSHA
jgi:ABC-type nitrate/sulfonate/bicarbonate transport system substrate-binding protein